MMLLDAARAARAADAPHPRQAGLALAQPRAGLEPTLRTQLPPTKAKYQ
jgi:hypothetical protein